jgi:hypothetical protein
LQRSENFFSQPQSRTDFPVPMSPAYNKLGGVMSIEALLLVLLVTFGVASVLSRFSGAQKRQHWRL